jgi:prepilin-type N-terminal cleavage/methylation domain-containing protein
MRLNIEKSGSRGGFTLIELMAAITIVGLTLMIAQPNIFGLFRRSKFKNDIQGFISTMQMAASSAAEGNRRYEVQIDLTEQRYLLREITSAELSVVLEDEIIVDNDFSQHCYAAYVEFDDQDWTNDGVAKFRVSGSGWQYGGKIVFLDMAEHRHSVIVNRINRIVKVVEGDVDLLGPKRESEI